MVCERQQQKIRAMIKVKSNSVEHLTRCLPYGYIKSPEDPKLWIKDEEVARFVYEIGFYVYGQFRAFTNRKKADGVENPHTDPRYESTGIKRLTKKQSGSYDWNSSTIAHIMNRWREYLGHTANFNTRKKSYKSKKPS